MSVLIRGIEMPKTCDECFLPLRYCDYAMKRGGKCPLIEIPPHGDLIDKHKLIDGIMYELGASAAIGDKEEYAHWERVLTYVRKSTTIIEAEVSD